jgi:Cupin-like domain
MAADDLRTVEAASPAQLAEALAQGTRPVLLRGLVAHWPLVQAGLRSDAALLDHLRQFDCGATVDVWHGRAEIDGRFFYNDDLSGFNFSSQRMPFQAVLGQLLGAAQTSPPPALYMGATTVDTCLPGLLDTMPIDLGGRDALASVWLGNRSRIATHQDLPDNLACVVAGRRRFTLFPPAQLPNLYIGPLDRTPAGQPISLVDVCHPDLQRFPRFADALADASVADLGPGDALYIPSLWWHHVQALAPLNLLINHWWRDTPAHMDTPMNALMHALLSVRDLPAHQRQAWAQLFHHYVFDADAGTTAHIPPAARGLLAPLAADTARLLRAQLLRRLNR